MKIYKLYHEEIDLELFDYPNVLSRGVYQEGLNTVIFSYDGLDQIISMMATANILDINYRQVIPLFNFDNPIVNITREYMLLVVSAKNNIMFEEYERLIVKKFDKNNFLQNSELLEYVNTNVVPDVLMLRRWDYGYYCLKRFSEELFNNIPPKKYKNFLRLNESSKQMTIEQLHDKVKKALGKEFEEMDNINYEVLLLVFNYRIKRENISLTTALDFSFVVISNSHYLLKNWKGLKMQVEKIIDSGLDLNKSKKNKIKM